MICDTINVVKGKSNNYGACQRLVLKDHRHPHPDRADPVPRVYLWLPLVFSTDRSSNRTA